MPDTNLIGFAGPQDNGKTVEITETLNASIGFSSALKFTSAVQNISVTAGTVIGGHDACVDCNNSPQGVVVTIDEARPTGQFAALAKGGAHAVTVIIKRLVGHGKVADLMTDDWSDQSHAATSGIVWNVTSADGSPVTVLALKTKPSFAGGGPYRFLFPWPWINPAWLGHPWGFAFDTLRRWGFFRSQSNANNTPK